MSLPGKGRKGHICSIIMTSWWRHLERNAYLLVQQKLLHCGHWDMSS